MSLVLIRCPMHVYIFFVRHFFEKLYKIRIRDTFITQIISLHFIVITLIYNTCFYFIEYEENAKLKFEDNFKTLSACYLVALEDTLYVIHIHTYIQLANICTEKMFFLLFLTLAEKKQKSKIKRISFDRQTF